MYLYTTDSCPKCFATKRQLDKYNLFYIEVKVTDEIATDLKAQGFHQLPVVTTDTDSWEGYRPNKIKAIIDQLINVDR